MSEFPKGWADAELGDLLNIQSGFAFKSSEYKDEGHFLIRIGNVQDGEISLAKPKYVKLNEQTKHFELLAGDILTSLTGNIGRVARIEQQHLPAALNQRVARLTPADKLDDDGYLFCFLSSPLFREALAALGKGGAQQNVSPKTISDIAIPLPPLPEQRRIVRKLDTLSARTTTARSDLKAIPDLVERYKLNFLRSAFRGEQTAQFRQESELETVSQLLGRTEAPQQGRGGRKPTDEVIPGKGGLSVNHPGTELPIGWDWVPLLRVSRQETGHTPSRSHPEWWDGDVRWISIPDANTHHGRVIYDTIQKTNEDGLKNSSARLLPKGTVVLSRTASVGYVTIMGCEMATSQDFATWTCSDALDPKYLMYALLSEGDDIRNFGEGTTHTTIYFPEVRAFNIKLAPLAEQREIVHRIETAFTKIDRLAAEAEKALKLTDRLDQRILAKAFVGGLVPQDPTDEPATELLARIRKARATAPKPKRGRRKKAEA
ncbi:restriction endonuclease subunit S [Celeribacter sp. SCSIO 80788]|uniref:restriction endonuclease subunit S n=1 Tax=Celeribacter sp. SCSIO 80788 TaxID=3117013 RepID=UPI003DA2A3A3